VNFGSGLGLLLAAALGAGGVNQLARRADLPYYPGMGLRIATIAERPDLKSSFADPATDPWPAFMSEDPISLLYYSDVRIAQPEYGLIAYDAAAPDQAVARA